MLVVPQSNYLKNTIPEPEHRFVYLKGKISLFSKIFIELCSQIFRYSKFTKLHENERVIQPVNCLFVICILLQGCASEQDITLLRQESLQFDDLFSTIDNDNWTISQQSLDSGSGAVATTPTGIQTTHVMTNNDSCFVYNNAEILSSELRLNATGQTFNCPDANNIPNYSGGELRSASTFTNGRFTAQLQTFIATGTLTSFYLYSSTSEIGFHFSGNDPTTVYLSHNDGNFSSITTPVPSESSIEGFDASNQINTYEILWHKDLIQWSINGKPILSTKINVPDSSMRLIISIWADGDSTLAGTPASNLTAYTEFDRVRVATFPTSL